MSVIVRIAPSPTGKLHVGNIRTSLVNWLFARKSAGKFILRLDDTDTERSTEEFARGIETDLAWLGLTHDFFAKQSDRTAVYDAAAERLKQMGRLYACYETAEELDRKRKRQQAAHKPPLYDRAALSLTAEERAEMEAKGRRPHWRFKLDGRRMEWNDLTRGPQQIDTASQSDPVLIREDGRYLYTLPSVIDDIDFGITHIIRGEDHVTNTGTQIEIFEALGAKVPAFAHLALLVGAGGEGLSKRTGALSIDELRSDGIEAMAINSLLGKIGTSDPVVPRTDLAELIADFDMSHIGRAPAHFDPAELRTLNHKLLHATPYEQVQKRLIDIGVPGGVAFWDAVRDNIQVLNEAKVWWDVVAGSIQPVIEDSEFASEARGLLPAGPYTEETWHEWSAAVSRKSGVKGKALYKPLRLALTGQDHGPEMRKLLPLIGPERAARRLSGQAA